MKAIIKHEISIGWKRKGRQAGTVVLHRNLTAGAQLSQELMTSSLSIIKNRSSS